jgi:hypothetical protein
MKNCAKKKKKKTNQDQGQINDPGTQSNGTSQINGRRRLIQKNSTQKTDSELSRHLLKDAG